MGREPFDRVGNLSSGVRARSPDWQWFHHFDNGAKAKRLLIYDPQVICDVVVEQEDSLSNASSILEELVEGDVCVMKDMRGNLRVAANTAKRFSNKSNLNLSRPRAYWRYATYVANTATRSVSSFQKSISRHTYSSFTRERLRYLIGRSPSR